MWIPRLLTIIFIALVLLIALLLMLAAWRHRSPPISDLGAMPEDIREFGPAATNRWLVALRYVLLLLLATVFGFHAYWVFKADAKDSVFAKAKRNDARNLRLAEAGLKGWVFDRSGKLENALIRYRNDAGIITRDYPLGAAAVHLTGYSDFIFGAGGMEYAYRDWLTEPASTYNKMSSPTPVGQDLKVTIDAALQRETYGLLQATGKRAAAIVLLLPNNEVLSMASAPSFEPRSINDASTWQRMSDQAENAPLISPLVNRALGTLVTGGAASYYAPGSTFKTFIAAVAIDSGVTQEQFTCTAEGFTPPGSGRAIRDFEGEVHGTLGLADAFKVSCNQYFAQLGLKLGKERLASYARRMMMQIAPDEGIPRMDKIWEILHGRQDRFDYVFAPPMTKMNLSAKATAYDVALQSFGQGYDDLTVMGMALIASAVAGADGNFVAPTFEPGAPRKVLSQFVTPQTAAQVRALMRQVVEGGTASGAFAALRGRITAGGKTGTADRVVPVYDNQGKRVLDYVEKDGDKHYKTEGLTDSWFVGFAPADNPQIVYAVVVENGGQGAKAAAPIAVKLIDKAAQLGYVTAGTAPAPPAATRPVQRTSH
ncbi:MAG TPA: penicillin-binding transpeptidase domain-containing protein [Blastocatellia bacterium]|nr:penicillin-binding transpeptidase domain-containing protein [Blastocatellia bacterium]